METPTGRQCIKGPGGTLYSSYNRGIELFARYHQIGTSVLNSNPLYDNKNFQVNKYLGVIGPLGNMNHRK